MGSPTSCVSVAWGKETIPLNNNSVLAYTFEGDIVADGPTGSDVAEAVSNNGFANWGGEP